MWSQHEREETVAAWGLRGKPRLCNMKPYSHGKDLSVNLCQKQMEATGEYYGAE